MKNKKINRIIAISIITIIILIGVVTFILNYSKDNTSLSIVEKKWITNNINNIIDVNVYNDIPIYGYNGNGIIFDFLNKFTEEYNIKFNKISYYSNDKPTYDNIAFKVLDNEEQLTENDILLYKDNYVVLAKNYTIIKELEEITTKPVGILKSDKTTITNYFDDNTNIKEYDDIKTLISDLNNEQITYIIIPNMMYMDKILSNDLNIIYHINDLNKQYILSVKDNTIRNIMDKYYTKYFQTDYKETYSKEYLNIYFNS